MNNNYPIYKQKFPYKFNLSNELLPSTITYRVLSKRELLDLSSLYSSDNIATNLFKVKVVETSLEDGKDIINYLSDDDIDTLSTEILKKSVATEEVISLLKELYALSIDPVLQTDTWECEVCKERGLQEVRACGFLPEKERNQNFQVYAGGELHNICPIYKLQTNISLLSSAVDAYNFYDKGILPEEGGAFDQTTWFLSFASTMASLVKEEERKALEKDN